MFHTILTLLFRFWSIFFHPAKNNVAVPSTPDLHHLLSTLVLHPAACEARRDTMLPSILVLAWTFLVSKWCRVSGVDLWADSTTFSLGCRCMPSVSQRSRNSSEDFWFVLYDSWLSHIFEWLKNLSFLFTCFSFSQLELRQPWLFDRLHPPPPISSSNDLAPFVFESLIFFTFCFNTDQTVKYLQIHFFPSAQHWIFNILTWEDLKIFYFYKMEILKKKRHFEMWESLKKGFETFNFFEVVIWERHKFVTEQQDLLQKATGDLDLLFLKQAQMAWKIILTRTMQNFFSLELIVHTWVCCHHFPWLGSHHKLLRILHCSYNKCPLELGNWNSQQHSALPWYPHPPRTISILSISINLLIIYGPVNFRGQL